MTDYRDDPRPDGITVEDVTKAIAGLRTLAASFVPWRRRPR